MEVGLDAWGTCALGLMSPTQRPGCPLQALYTEVRGPAPPGTLAWSISASPQPPQPLQGAKMADPATPIPDEVRGLGGGGSKGPGWLRLARWGCRDL